MGTRSKSGPAGPRTAPRVIQACFPERRVPDGRAIQRFARVAAPPHPATVAQPRAAIGGAAPRPPHPATVAQPRAAFGGAARPAVEAHAFKPPAGFLEGPHKEGAPLPTSLKLRMERYFQADFSDVRVHL